LLGGFEVLDQSSGGSGHEFQAGRKRLAVATPEGDVPTCAKLDVQAEVSARGVGNGLGFEFGCIARCPAG